MKVCIINRLMGIHRGGGEYFDLNVAQALVNLGHEVHIVTGQKLSGITKPVLGFDATYVKTPYLADYHYWGNRKDAGWVARRLGGYAWYYDGKLFERRVFSMIEKEIIPDADLYQLCGRYRLASRLSLELSKVAVCWWPGPPTLNDDKRSKIVSYAGNFARGASMQTLLQIDPQAQNIPPGVDLNLFRPREKTSLRDKFRLSRTATIVLFVGRLIPIKNLQLLINAFAAAESENREIILAIVGEGTERSALKQTAEQLGVKRKVLFIGAVEGEYLAEWYSVADIFVIPSLYESFSIVTLEALASGLPVIASDVGYLSTLIKPEQNGLLFSSGDMMALTQAILSLSGNNVLRVKMGDVGRRFVELNYGWDKIGGKIETFYERVIQDGTGRKCA